MVTCKKPPHALSAFANAARYKTYMRTDNKKPTVYKTNKPGTFLPALPAFALAAIVCSHRSAEPKSESKWLRAPF
jgi:hypothetical protein